MDTHSLDLTSLGSVDIDMENLVATCWNDEGSTNVDEPGTPESWCTAIDNNPLASPHAEGTACNDIPCIQRIEPNTDDSLALVVSNFNKRIYNSIVDAPDSADTVYDRQAKRRREDGASMVETTTRDRGHDIECSRRVPIEIYERIIDHVAEECQSLERGYIARCVRVCREWVPRAQMQLFSVINLLQYINRPSTLAGFRAAVQRKPFLLQFIKFLDIDNNNHMSQQTTIFSSYHMPYLQWCKISGLDLSRVHLALYRFPSSATSLQILYLDVCKTRNLNQLCRFLTSFRSLSIVIIEFSLDNPLSGPNLPHLQFNRSKCPLQILALELKPNLSTLLKYFIKSPPFVSHLRHLIIAYSDRPMSPHPLQDITELLEHCSQSLEEVTVICGAWRVYFEYSLFSILPQAHPYYILQGEHSTDNVGFLDDILSDERFCSLRKLRIRVKMEPIEFPKLRERGVDIDLSDKKDSIPL
ncbi:hypothetical protein QCA50_013501 [Cerrena zonata]|uniref:F-box domain-containing protein n=1 Tax=Cerrena zonata TaxID=2478898 RepID=A0AAW0FVY1_9APHY